MLIILVYLLIILILSFLFIGIIWGGFSIAPWVPCKKKDLQRINKLADLKAGQVFYDLGCGDGRVCKYMAKYNPDCKIIGIEIALPIYLLARLIKIFSIYDYEVKRGNIFNQDLSRADVVYTYALSTTINKKLKQKFVKDLKNNCKIISYAFKMNDWKGKVHKGQVPIFVYKLEDLS